MSSRPPTGSSTWARKAGRVVEWSSPREPPRTSHWRRTVTPASSCAGCWGSRLRSRRRESVHPLGRACPKAVPWCSPWLLNFVERTFDTSSSARRAVGTISRSRTSFVLRRSKDSPSSAARQRRSLMPCVGRSGATECGNWSAGNTDWVASPNLRTANRRATRHAQSRCRARNDSGRPQGSSGVLRAIAGGRNTIRPLLATSSD